MRRNRRFRRLRVGAVALFALSAMVACGGLTVASAGAAVRHGGTPGELTVIMPNIQWPTLDPALNPQAETDYQYENNIYGQLFQQIDKSTIVPSIASGYTWSDHNLLFTIDLRKGVKFSDGNPLNAKAVEFSMQRDLNPANGCDCLSSFKQVTSISTDGAYKVEMHLSTPYAPILDAFIEDPLNWVVDPTALSQMGATAYGQSPVGAGPFRVVSNLASSQIVLQKNPHYFMKGEPYLSRLTFIEVASPESAFSALQSGEGQMILGPLDSGTLTQAQAEHWITFAPGISATVVELNTSHPPFNDITARECIYYATDWKPVLHVGNNGLGTYSESPSGPGGFFYEKTVPGYRTFNLAKAKACVAKLGGTLDVTIFGGAGAATTEMEALESQWEQAGITVTSIETTTLQETVSLYATNSWEMTIEAEGDTEPALGVHGLYSFFSSFGEFTGVHDPVLDGMINRSVQLVNEAARTAAYRQIFKYISDKAYGPMLYVAPVYEVNVPGVKGATPLAGPGGGGGPQINWVGVKFS